MNMRDERLILLLIKELQNIKGLKVSILTHVGGDPDSICSAFVLKKIMEKIFEVGKVYIIVPESPTSHAKTLLEYFSIDLYRDFQNVDAYFVVDVGSPEQLGEYSKIIFREDKIVVVLDHHSETKRRYPYHVKVYSNESYQSLCELIYDLSEYINLELDMKDSEALFIGIYYDTVRLSIADVESSRKICKLISKGMNLGNILARLEHSMDVSERIARLKGASRMKIYRFGDWLIVLTTVSRFQGAVARSLITLGAHLALAVGEVERDLLRASIRASVDFIEKTKINVGVDLAHKLGVELKGYGGGHASAAHFECRTTIEEVFNRFIEELSNMLKIEPEVVEA